MRSYKDNEVDNEEEEKLHMTQAALPMKPFGLNIRKAAYKATFGSGNSYNVLARYTRTAARFK